jgi:hypothetical protein
MSLYVDVLTRAHSYLVESNIRPDWTTRMWSNFLSRVWYLMVTRMDRVRDTESEMYQAIRALARRDYVEDEVIMRAARVLLASCTKFAVAHLLAGNEAARAMGYTVVSMNPLTALEANVVDWCLDGDLLSEWGVREWDAE